MGSKKVSENDLTHFSNHKQKAEKRYSKLGFFVMLSISQNFYCILRVLRMTTIFSDNIMSPNFAAFSHICN